ncbi:MAG: flagellar basal body P-ring formation chaperone FlgA [Actinomycetota bacterium]
MKKTLLVLFFFVLSVISAFAENLSTIRVSSETTIENDVVKLGNIAEITGETEKIERLKTVSLGYSPNVGVTREISREQITLAISAAGFSESEIVLDSPPKILIRRAGQTVSQIQFRTVIETFLTNKFSGDQISAQIIRLDLPEILQVPKGIIEIRPNFSTVQNFFQPFSVPVEIRVDGKVFHRISANIEIEAFAEVLVATKDLTVNSKISESDVRLEKRRIEKPITNYLRETAKLRGLMLIKTIAGGTEITIDSYVAGVVIKTGDPVRVEAQSGKLKIIISGEARASGKIGDRIAVKNLQSGSILQAVVVDEGLVRVLF